jgi:hypothetical protein
MMILPSGSGSAGAPRVHGHGFSPLYGLLGYSGPTEEPDVIEQAVYHLESAYLEKAPTAQLTRIGAADRLFSVSLPRITSVPGCAVSSVEFLWGSGIVSRRCGVFVGLTEASGWPGRPPRSTQVPRLTNPDDHFPGSSASPERPARLW